VRHEGSLTLVGVPFLVPDDYDRLLWSCDLNFVRGEDSAVRAQWAAQPFVWQLYEQEAGAHFDKLDAFLALFAVSIGDSASVLAEFWHAWNGDPAAVLDWPALLSALPALAAHGDRWARQLASRPGLADSLIEFASEIG
jgi:uncharacterized repeat protein (TIGR03837 family)